MWRAFFYAIGIMLVVLGVECLVIDSATFQGNPQTETAPEAGVWGAPPAPESTKTVKPAEWQPWSFLATGSIVLLYAMTLKKGGE